LLLFFRLQGEDWAKLSVSYRAKGQRANEASVWLWWAGTNWLEHFV